MDYFDYLIVGGGMTADSAVKGIRAIDEQSSICIIGTETNPPYMRPPLTKGLWKGKPLDSIWYHTEENGVSLLGGRTVVSIDPVAKTVTDDQRGEFGFRKLLLATGATPRRMPIESNAIIYYRTVDDYVRLRGLSASGDRFVVVGGGFIGSEIAAGLAMNGKKVVMLFPDETIGARVYPPQLAQFITRYYGEKGVELRPGETMTGLSSNRGKHTVLTNLGKEIEVDGVVAGIGVVPNTELAAVAGLPTDNGIAVDELLNAGHPDIYAAGDVANFPSQLLGRRVRVEHEDNAFAMGRHAGRTMAGDAQPFTYHAYFYSDLFELGYEAVGDLNSSLEMYCDWQEPFQKGVVYYLSEGRVRGVLLWNVWDKVPDAREIIAAPGPFAPGDLKGRIQ